jgi:threonine/homoserine/homoserine lactone efflux protein
MPVDPHLLALFFAPSIIAMVIPGPDMAVAAPPSAASTRRWAPSTSASASAGPRSADTD